MNISHAVNEAVMRCPSLAGRITQHTTIENLADEIFSQMDKMEEAEGSTTWEYAMVLRELAALTAVVAAVVAER